MANEKTITIKLVKSAHGRKPNQAKTLKALGLSKIKQLLNLTMMQSEVWLLQLLTW